MIPPSRAGTLRERWREMDGDRRRAAFLGVKLLVGQQECRAPVANAAARFLCMRHLHARLLYCSLYPDVGKADSALPSGLLHQVHLQSRPCSAPFLPWPAEAEASHALFSTSCCGRVLFARLVCLNFLRSLVHSLSFWVYNQPLKGAWYGPQAATKSHATRAPESWLLRLTRVLYRLRFTLIVL